MARSQFDLSPERVMLEWEVEFEGFVSTIGRLTRCGWEVTTHHDLYRDWLHVALRRPRAGPNTRGVIFTGAVSQNEMTRRHPGAQRLRINGVMTDDAHITLVENMAPVWDNRPGQPGLMGGIRESTYKAVDFYGFNEAAKTPTGLYIPQDRIGEALEMIHKLQAPDQAAIRARNREVPAEKLEAVILSIAA